MRRTTTINVEHIVVISNRSYGDVKASLEAQLGAFGNTDELTRRWSMANASWEQIKQAIEEQLGTSGFSIFSKVEQGQLLALAGKPARVCQYAIGNPLLAIQMIEHAPEVALYAPLRLAVYEDDGGTFIAYDRFTSLLAQYQSAEIRPIAELVEQKLEELVARATAEPDGKRQEQMT
jgi:uncharacterized protein (DUF302 family)